VTFTGRLVSYKGLPLLLRVWHDIRAKHSDAVLVLVGSGSLDMHNCEAELRQYVNVHNLLHSVRFTGSVRNVHEYLQASDIFVLPSENEAFPVALIEAMAGGLAVITTAVGGVKDIVEHSKNGLVVQAGDFGQLYSALDILLADAGLADRLGQAARRTAQERYSQEMVTRQYAELFERVAMRARRLPRWA
jgi:glycosyltransferase involved in cell wall biosynthesis